MQVRPLEGVLLPAECSPCGTPQGPGWTFLLHLHGPGGDRPRHPSVLEWACTLTAGTARFFICLSSEMEGGFRERSLEGLARAR